MAACGLSSPSKKRLIPLLCIGGGCSSSSRVDAGADFFFSHFCLQLWPRLATFPLLCVWLSGLSVDYFGVSDAVDLAPLLVPLLGQGVADLWMGDFSISERRKLLTLKRSGSARSGSVVGKQQVFLFWTSRPEMRERAMKCNPALLSFHKQKHLAGFSG